jgi:hypothetical protein
MSTKFGERKSATWSQKDWNAHKRLESALLDAVKTADRLGLDLGGVKVPSRSAFDLPESSAKRGVFMMQYAMDLNRTYLKIKEAYDGIGWITNVESLGTKSYVIRTSRYGFQKERICSSCKSMLCVQTWIMTMYAMNTIKL